MSPHTWWSCPSSTYAIDANWGGYAGTDGADLGYHCCCVYTPPCHDNPAPYQDPAGLSCYDWSLDLNSDGAGDCTATDSLYVTSAADCSSRQAATAPNSYPCEIGGYGPMNSAQGWFYYPKTSMDEVRSECPVACNTTCSY